MTYSVNKKIMKLVLFTIAICITSSINAADLKPPFGIRYYDIGKAPDFNLTDMDSDSFTLGQNQGEWIFLHFWASWCGPCREEMPTIQKLANALPKLKIVMINTAEEEDTIFTFLSAIDIELNSLMDIDGMVTESWKPRGLPTTFLINPAGNVKYQAVGGREWDKPLYINFLKQLIEK